MKILLLTGSILCSNMAIAETKKPGPVVELKNHVTKMILEKKNSYRLWLLESAAVYHAQSKFSSCLEKSIKEQKIVTLKVSAYSLQVIDCKNE